MNILTKNRIIEKGDEYKDKDGTWKPVPSKAWEMQVMFSPYKEVRRPAEPASVAHVAKVIDRNAKIKEFSPAAPVLAEPPDRASVDVKTEGDEARESNKTQVPIGLESRGGGGNYLPTYREVLRDHFDTTVISAKAHGKSGTLKEFTIPYPDLSAVGTSPPIWIGRNGTFKATAINFLRVSGDIIQIKPEGKRGLAKNALIEFPVAIIPQIMEWLDEQNRK